MEDKIKKAIKESKINIYIGGNWFDQLMVDEEIEKISRNLKVDKNKVRKIVSQMY